MLRDLRLLFRIQSSQRPPSKNEASYSYTHGGDRYNYSICSHPHYRRPATPVPGTTSQPINQHRPARVHALRPERDGKCNELQDFLVSSYSRICDLMIGSDCLCRNKLAPVAIQPKCDDGEWEMFFPSGIENITAFTLQVNRVSGADSQIGVVHLKSGVGGWGCKENNALSAVRDECVWSGVLHVPVQGCCDSSE